MNKCISWGTPHRCQQRHYAQTQPSRSSVIMFSGVCPHRDIHSLLAGSPAVTASLSASQSAENTPHTKPDLSERSLAPNRPTFKHVNDYHRRLIIKCVARIQTSTLSKSPPPPPPLCSYCFLGLRNVLQHFKQTFGLSIKSLWDIILKLYTLQS